jgi:hypothetical protein
MKKQGIEEGKERRKAEGGKEMKETDGRKKRKEGICLPGPES